MKNHSLDLFIRVIPINLLIILVLHICCLCSYAQKTNYLQYDNINLELEANIITCFLQDEQGLLWLGSGQGLYSFDGYSSQPHFKQNELSNKKIYCGVIIDKSYLYLGTDNGILVYNNRTDNYEASIVNFSETVLCLTLQGRKLWIGTLNGLYLYDLDTRKLHAFKDDLRTGLSHQSVYSILRTHDDQIYIGTYNGLCKYIPESGTFQQISVPANSLKKNQFINALLEDRGSNCIWIGMEGGLYRMEPLTEKIEQIESFHNNSIKSLATDGYKNLLVGTDNGLYVYNESSPPLHILHDSRDSRSLTNNIIWSIFIDHDRNVWLGTDSGISVSRFNQMFDYISISQITGTGEGNHFYSLFKDSRGYYWFGGTNGIIRADAFASKSYNAHWYKMGHEAFPISHNRVRHIYEDKDRLLWIATDGSIHRYDYATKQFLQYNVVDSTGRNNSNWAYQLFEDNNGKLWISTCLGGVLVVDKQKLLKAGNKNVVAEQNYSVHNGLSGNFIKQMLPDHEGNVWVLLFNDSISKINASTQKVTQFPVHQFIGDKGLNYLLCDSRGMIWVGFRGGVLQIDPKSNVVRTISFDSFLNNDVLSMLEIEESIWISTSGGLWEVNKTSLDARWLNLANQSFIGMYYDKDNKELILGTLDGIAVTTPQKLAEGNTDLPVFITALYINNRRLELPNKSIRYAESIELDYKQNNLSIELSDLPYSLEKKSMFVYKLQGIDRNWNFLSSGSNKLSYNNLQPGNYRLIVSKLDKKGKPAQGAYSLNICVNSPWYGTLWAKLVYTLLFVSLVVWVINYFRVKYRLKMESLEKEKILEQSRLKMEFLGNLSHDFKTPLSLIITPLSKLLPEIKDPQEKKLLEGVQRNAIKLNSLTHQMLDFNRIDNSSNALLILSRVEFVEFARNIFNMFEELTRKKALNFFFKTDIERIDIDIDVIKWESVLTNLLSNAVKYTPRNGTITLTLCQSTDAIEIGVTDNGIGIPQSDIPHIFQRFFRSSRILGKKEGTGIGLYLVRTYVELHGGTVHIESQENEGTSAKVTLPISVEKQLVTIGESSSKALVLLVEDNPEMLEMIKGVIGNRYRISTAGNGKEGLELCQEIHPDIIITDLVMPVMDGIEMCRHIKEQLPLATIPVILLTAKSDKTTELESIRQNIDVFIAKPFEPQILLSRIEQILNSKESFETKARMEVITTPKAIESVSVDEKFLLDLTRLIEDRISDFDLSVNAICEQMEINNKQMYRKTKLLTGMTPVEYIRSIRMKKASMFLAKQTFTVAEVMYMVGFTNSSYFSKCFQSEFGVTPKQYLSGEK